MISEETASAICSAGPSCRRIPTRRRHSFKVATVWLLAVGTLLTTGATTAALVLGGLLVVACAMVTTTNLCLPSEALAWWERRATAREAFTT